ncbi:hypothetical protein [Streptomyces sp. NPDC001933]|uniref:hypothetical protein n=1 Tax=Streptomyces sp. NPDC001933 TaxID=3364626 RepID=UPI0036B1EBEB
MLDAIVGEEMMKRLMLAIIGAIALLLAVPAVPALAADVQCTTNGTNEGYNARCDRRIYDHDAGGVSGSATVYSLSNSKKFVSIRFEANGEHVYVTNATGKGTSYWVSVNGDVWEQGTVQGAASGKTKNLNIPENQVVQIGVCIGIHGCAILSTLIS